MKIKQLLILLLILLLSGAGVATSAQQAETSTKISGSIVNGLRLLSIGPDKSDNHFVVYRGDYIQPALVGSPSFEISIAELKINKAFPAATGTKPYIKMKKPGTYSFTTGEYKGTIEVIEYSAKHYNALSAAEADQIMKNIQPLLLDVRTPGEYQSGRIDGAKLIPVQALQQQLATLEAYKQQEILIYCASGNRSTVASRILIENGFEKIFNLRYGIKDWSKRGFPVE